MRIKYYNYEREQKIESVHHTGIQPVIYICSIASDRLYVCIILYIYISIDVDVADDDSEVSFNNLCQAAHRLHEYSLETGIATIIDGNDIIKVNTEHLRDLTFRVGSVYQFIGELRIQPENEGVLQARVGRNVDGIDLNLYHQSVLLLKEFQANHLNNPAT